MNSKEFFKSVCELRRWQREYAKTRRTEEIAKQGVEDAFNPTV